MNAKQFYIVILLTFIALNVKAQNEPVFIDKMVDDLMKKVADFGISFNDDFSGVHSISGLVWQKVRVDVLKSIAKFDITYNNKY